MCANVLHFRAFRLFAQIRRKSAEKDPKRGSVGQKVGPKSGRNPVRDVIGTSCPARFRPHSGACAACWLIFLLVAMAQAKAVNGRTTEETHTPLESGKGNRLAFSTAQCCCKLLLWNWLLQ